MKLPLTQSQLQIWLGHQLAPGSAKYNSIFIFLLDQGVNLSHLETAFDLVVNQCGTLRTRITPDGQQEIQSSVVYSWKSISVQTESDFKDWLDQQKATSIPIDDVLFTTAIVSIEENNEQYWYLNLHHIIVDATSVTIIHKYLWQFYDELQRKSEDFPSIPQFTDYLQIEARNRGSKSTHWNNKVSRIAQPTTLYHVKPPVVQSSRSPRTEFDIPVETMNQLKAMSVEPDMRCWSFDLFLYNFFITALFIHLYRTTNRNDLIIGTPAHNRTTPALKNTIGLLIEFLPFTVKIEPTETFGSLFQKVRVETMDFLKNSVPGSANMDFAKSYHVIFNFINAQFEQRPEIKKIDWIHPDECDSNHHARIHLYRFYGEQYTLALDLNSEVFEQLAPQFVVEHIVKIIKEFLTDRSALLNGFSLLGPNERIEVQKALRGPIVPIDLNLSNKLTFSLNDQGNRNHIALEIGDKVITYHQLNEVVIQWMKFLQEKYPDCTRIVLCQERSEWVPIEILGCLQLGISFVPLPKSTPIARLEYILSSGEVDLMIYDGEEKFSGIDIIHPSMLKSLLSEYNSDALKPIVVDQNSEAYMIYTSGSTGTPKGVKISYRSLSNYLQFALSNYDVQNPVIPLCTSIGFDLTMTSMLLPFFSGGKLIVFPEKGNVDLSVIEALQHTELTHCKITPSHLQLLSKEILESTRIKVWILGGEQLHSRLITSITDHHSDAKIFNEYGPTEATIGCIVYQFRPDEVLDVVPIGKPIQNSELLLLDQHGHQVPQGQVGELMIGGDCLAIGYSDLALTESKFPMIHGNRYYRAGDLCYLRKDGSLVYIGREDNIVKIGGKRQDLGEIESKILTHPGVDAVSVRLMQRNPVQSQVTHNCVQCGLPDNYPGITFNEEGLCSVCETFEGYQRRMSGYFKTMQSLEELLKAPNPSEYDCLVLLSGGKDSSYALASLAKMNVRILAFTLDNGYISDFAKKNINLLVSKLGVDHVYGTTEFMNEIFVDSLKQFSNVCNGCFKTIYTLSTKLALEKSIPYIVTGLSRGQFFETRLSGDLFWHEKVDASNIDKMVLDARKAYHRNDDFVNQVLDASFFHTDDVFEKVQYIDFYRFCDVSLSEMLRYLTQEMGWQRPADTGRSTNCLINEAGIFVHKHLQGYHNYAFPYSWDVRMGHKTREETLHEINEVIDPDQVMVMLNEIGYDWDKEANQQLFAFYNGDTAIKSELESSLLKWFTPDLLPTLIALEQIPINENGKVDENRLQEVIAQSRESEIISEMDQIPQSDIEEYLFEIWSEALRTEKIGRHQNFVQLGGQSLQAIQVTSRINSELELQLPLTIIFENPTIASLGDYLTRHLEQLIDSYEE